MPITRTDILTDLSYLLGEQSVPTSGITDRQAFIQRTIDEVYRAYPWPQAFATATITMTNNAGTMASNYLPNGPLDVRVVVSGAADDYIWEQIPVDEGDDYKQGSYKYWLTGGDPNFVINSKETDGAVTARYQTKAPQVNASITIPFEDPMIFALGALRYVRISEEPGVDITQEEDNFKMKLDELIALQRRNRPHARRKTLAERSGWHTGSF